MLNSNSVIYQIKLPIYPDFHILNKNVSNLGTKLTVMIPIDEEEEKLIDNIDKSTLKFNRGNKSFSISMKDSYCDGEVDFEDKDTLNQINEFKFLDYLCEVGVHIYARDDYKTHSCSSPKRCCLWTETWSPSQLAKMAHGYLGKPKRILLFNYNTK